MLEATQDHRPKPMVIDASDPRLRVMISSTTVDLPAHREAVCEAILRAGHTPVMMEFGSAEWNSDAIKFSLQKVEQAQVYIGIFGLRYGYIPDDPVRNPQRFSITELEYRHAVKLGIPTLVYIAQEIHPFTKAQIDLDSEKCDKLVRLKGELTKGICGLFDSADDLKSLVLQSLHEVQVNLDENQSSITAAKPQLPVPPTSSAVPNTDREITKHGWVMSEVQTVHAFAFTITITINEFSKQSGAKQWLWYSSLNSAMAAVLSELRIPLAKETDGDVFWSPKGNGGTLSIIQGGVESAMRFAVQTAGELNKRFDLYPRERFDIRIGIAMGQVQIGLDLDGRPNVWGAAISNSHRISAACAPGQVLASEEFIKELRSHTTEMDDYIDKNYLTTHQPHKRLTEHGRFFSVVNLHHAPTRVGHRGGDTPTHVPDFEGPRSQMIRNYQDYLSEVVRAKSGVWTLLLSRKLSELGALKDDELFKSYISPVSAEGGHDPNHPRDPFFSCFPAHELQEVMRQGEFKPWDRGQDICQIGDTSNELYVIAHGKLEIYDNRGKFVARRVPGDIVGEMALVEAGHLDLCVNNPKRTARMVTSTDEDVTLFAIPYQAIRNAVRSSSMGDEILRALILSYSKRQKENALREAKCFQYFGSNEKDSLRATGDFKGLRPGMEWPDTGMADSLIVCCHGKITVERNKDSCTLRGQSGGPMESVWLPSRGGANDRRCTVTTETPSEFIVWYRQNWHEWLRSATGRNRRAFIAESCDSTIY